MAKGIYLGHNLVSHQYYINDHGDCTTDKNVTYTGPDNNLQAVVRHLAATYKDRKAVLKTDLPKEKISELQRLIEKNKALKKMELEHDSS